MGFTRGTGVPSQTACKLKLRTEAMWMESRKSKRVHSMMDDKVQVGLACHHVQCLDGAHLSAPIPLSVKLEMNICNLIFRKTQSLTRHESKVICIVAMICQKKKKNCNRR